MLQYRSSQADPLLRGGEASVRVCEGSLSRLDEGEEDRSVGAVHRRAIAGRRRGEYRVE